MPSILIGNRSGGQPLISGNYYSGQTPKPQGSVFLKWDGAASGNAYVGLSGGVTAQSGSHFLSGATLGALDGIPMARGESLTVPRYAFQVSGTLNVWIGCDAAASGTRMYFEVY